MRRVLLVAGLIVLASPSVAWPDEPPLLPDVVDTLDVVAERPERIEVVPTFATVHDVVGSVESVSTVADVIESGAGVHVRRYGGLGAYATASIRASSPSQVEVYLDGIPIQSAQWGITNLADLPLDGLQRIEVYRGGAPSEFGTPGIGGVINLVTRVPGRGRSFASVSTGSHGTWKVDLLRAGSIRSFGYAASYHHLRSEGDFEYLDRHGTPENPDDDAIVVRENNAFRQSDALLNLTLPSVAGWRLELTDEFFRKESGVPGIENVHIESVHVEALRNIAFARIEPPPLAHGVVGIKGTAFHQYRRDLFFNPDDEVGFNRSDTDNRATGYGGNLEATLRWLGNRHTLRLFGEIRRERFVPEDRNPNIGVGFTRRRRASTISAEDRLVLLGDRLELVAAYRYQEAVDNYTGPVPFGAPPATRDDPHWSTFHGPTYGLRWWLAPTVTVKANRTRYARFPTMMELFGAGGYVEGNPELDREEGVTTDAGIVVRTGADSGGSGLLEAVLFWADRDDLIVFLQNSQRTVKAFNLESARVEGVELTARRAWGSGIAVASSYTLQYARNDGPSPVYHGKALPYEPVHDLYVRTSYYGGCLGAWHEYHFESESYRDRANLPENLSSPSHVHNVGVRWEIVRDLLTATAEVRNLADRRLVDVEGFPLPGRTFFLTLTIGRDDHEGGVGQ